MPVVPRVTRQVQLEALPGVRLTAAETPESQGSGIAESQGQQAQALAGIGAKTAALGEGLYAKAIAEETKSADDIWQLNARSQFTRWNTWRLYDPNSGALSVKGPAAFGLPEQVGQEFNDQADEIAKTATTDRQKNAFATMRNEYALELHAAVMKHTWAEMQQYQAQELQAFLENSRNSAISQATDPRAIGLELQRQVDAIRTHAPQLGLGPEQLQKQIDATRSATHVGVIENLLAQEKSKTAQIYFEEAKDQISGEQIARLEKALKEGSTRKEGQTQADAILAAGGTLTEQREKARQIDDADVRDQVMTRLEHEWSVREVQQRQDTEAALKTAYDIVDRTKDVSKIPPTAWVSFSGGDRSALRAYAERLAKGEPIETDDTVYYSLMLQASGTPGYGTPQDFAKQNLLAYRGKLSDGDFKHFVELQTSIRNNQAKKPVIDDFRTVHDVLSQALRGAGIDPTPKDDDKEGMALVSRFYSLVATEQRRVQGITGKSQSNEDLEAITNHVLSRQIADPGWIFSGKKRLITATISDVPDAARRQIEQSLRRFGQPVTDDSVLNIWIQSQVEKGQ
jgi:hypothetical protein